MKNFITVQTHTLLTTWVCGAGFREESFVRVLLLTSEHRCLEIGTAGLARILLSHSHCNTLTWWTILWYRGLYEPGSLFGLWPGSYDTTQTLCRTFSALSRLRSS
jgi:hypothetical protein